MKEAQLHHVLDLNFKKLNSGGASDIEALPFTPTGRIFQGFVVWSCVSAPAVILQGLVSY